MTNKGFYDEIYEMQLFCRGFIAYGRPIYWICVPYWVAHWQVFINDRTTFGVRHKVQQQQQQQRRHSTNWSAAARHRRVAANSQGARVQLAFFIGPCRSRWSVEKQWRRDRLAGVLARTAADHGTRPSAEPRWRCDCAHCMQ